MTEPGAEPATTGRWTRIAVVVGLLLLPLGIGLWYRLATAVPGRVRIATGPEHGRYREVTASLGELIADRLDGVEVELVHTTGSYENLRRLRAGEVDFAIVQADVGHATTHDDDPSEVAFVANLYPESLHVVVRRDLVLDTLRDLRGRSVAIGPEDSGDRGTSEMLLAHVGLSPDDVDGRPLNYRDIEEGFADGTLDAAFVTTSMHSPVVEELLASGRCRLVPVPFTPALAARRLAVDPSTIPAGTYRFGDDVEPPDDVETVAVRAQLLCRADVHRELVAEVTRIVVGREFVKRNGFGELYAEASGFARGNPAFDVHPGASGVYEPETQPLLDPNFVEWTEGLRSFAVSLLIGVYLLYRWLRDRRIRQEEHALDDFIRRLLDIERRQLDLDEDPTAEEDLTALQGLLDEVTRLRQDALRDFSAHSLREDRATDTFLEMCHALSDKINAKITRQRLDRGLREVRDAVASGNAEGD